MRTQENGGPFEKVICGNEYNTYLISGTKGTEIMLKLWSICLPALGVALDDLMAPKNSKKDILDMEISLSTIAEKLAENMDVQGNLQIIKDLVTPCTRNGKQVDFDFDYRGQYKELFEVIQWVIDINYKDFFLSLFKEKLTNRLKEAKKKAASEFQST